MGFCNAHQLSPDRYGAEPGALQIFCLQLQLTTLHWVPGDVPYQQNLYLHAILPPKLEDLIEDAELLEGRNPIKASVEAIPDAGNDFAPVLEGTLVALFKSSVQSVLSCLSDPCCISIELVHHNLDRQEKIIVAKGAIPLGPLLQQSRIEGVLQLSAVGEGSPHAVQIARLHITMALEEGPGAARGAPPSQAATPQAEDLSSSSNISAWGESSPAPTGATRGRDLTQTSRASTLWGSPPAQTAATQDDDSTSTSRVSQPMAPRYLQRRRVRPPPSTSPAASRTTSPTTSHRQVLLQPRPVGNDGKMDVPKDAGFCSGGSRQEKIQRAGDASNAGATTKTAHHAVPRAWDDPLLSATDGKAVPSQPTGPKRRREALPVAPGDLKASSAALGVVQSLLPAGQGAVQEASFELQHHWQASVPDGEQAARLVLLPRQDLQPASQHGMQGRLCVDREHAQGTFSAAESGLDELHSLTLPVWGAADGGQSASQEGVGLRRRGEIALTLATKCPGQHEPSAGTRLIEWGACGTRGPQPDQTRQAQKAGARALNEGLASKDVLGFDSGPVLHLHLPGGHVPDDDEDKWEPEGRGVAAEAQGGEEKENKGNFREQMSLDPGTAATAVHQSANGNGDGNLHQPGGGLILAMRAQGGGAPAASPGTRDLHSSVEEIEAQQSNRGGEAVQEHDEATVSRQAPMRSSWSSRGAARLRALRRGVCLAPAPVQEASPLAPAYLVETYAPAGNCTAEIEHAPREGPPESSLKRPREPSAVGGLPALEATVGRGWPRMAGPYPAEQSAVQAVQVSDAGGALASLHPPTGASARGPTGGAPLSTAWESSTVAVLATSSAVGPLAPPTVVIQVVGAPSGPSGPAPWAPATQGPPQALPVPPVPDVPPIPQAFPVPQVPPKPQEPPGHERDRGTHSDTGEGGMPGDGSGRNPGAKPDTSQGLSTGQQGNATGSAQFQEGGGLFKKQNVAVGLAGSGRPLLGSAEFQTAWQLEVWKRSEQVKWRAAMEKEQSERLKALEAEWAAKEAARAAEWERWRVTQRNLQQRARQLVMAGEAREAGLAAAEERLEASRKQLERDAAARAQEAQSAVRRLKVEFEHRLSLERERELERSRQLESFKSRRDALEEQVASLDAEVRVLQRANHALEEKDSASAKQISQAQDAEKKALASAARALQSKKEYKAQVLKLAQRLAEAEARLQDLQRRHFDESELEENMVRARRQNPGQGLLTIPRRFLEPLRNEWKGGSPDPGSSPTRSREPFQDATNTMC